MPRIELNIEELQHEKAELDTFLARPDAYSDPDFSKKNKRLIELQNLLGRVGHGREIPFDFCLKTKLRCVDVEFSPRDFFIGNGA